MGGTLEVHWDHLQELYVSMAELKKESFSLLSYATDDVCSGAGFDYPTCALKPIGDQLPKIAGFFDQMYGTYTTKWDATGQSISDAVSRVANTDQQVNANLAYYLNGQLSASMPFGWGNLPGLAEFDSVPDQLTKPKDGEAQLRHPSKFDAAADAWDTARDIINKFIGFLNSVGAGLSKLDERSLRDYVVFPLAANYEKIGGNADACGHFADGMNTWAANFRTLGGKVDAAIGGRTGTALTVHLDVYSVVMMGIGEIVQQGSVVFKAIASMSEHIAVEVERVLTTMGEKLLKLSTKIASKAVPFVGWAMLAVDIAKHGFGVVQDVIDDINECKKLIEHCFDLVDVIKEWAEVQRDRLQAFHRVLDMVEQLPGVNATGGIAAVNGGVQHVQHTLDDIAQETGDAQETATDSLNDALGDLAGIQGEGDGDGGDGDVDVEPPDDDTVIMAPGPLTGPVYPGEPSSSSSPTTA